MQTSKTVWVALIAVAIIAIGGYFFPRIESAFGSSANSTNYSLLGVAGLKVGTGCGDSFSFNGCSGTQFARLNGGKCFIQAYATTIAASSTAQVDCQATAAVGGITTARDTVLTGITFGDNVVATLATSTAGTTSNGLVISGAAASSTSGYITLFISNLTGATFTWPTSGLATGTVNYFVTK